MRKRFLSTLLMGALVVASTSMVTSCKDYDDDINDLQAQIDANSKLIEQIQALISSGSVITNVESTSNGVKITLSNGESYEITNGEDGAAGTAWTIGDDGYWYKDGVKTDYYALGTKGEKGDKGDKGDTGDTGATGATGADGAYYYPNEDGYFHKVTADGTDTATNILWKATDNGAVTATMDDEYVTLSNVLLSNGSYSTVKIALSNNLRGFSFITDAADDEGNLLDPTIVDGVEAIQINSYSFNALTLSKKDSKDETAKEATKATVVNPDVYAYYKVEPAEASEEDLKTLVYRVNANSNYISTRAKASDDFAANAEFVEFKDGVLKVKVNVTGTPATEENISLVSLQATKRNNEVVEQSDDPETIYKTDDEDMRIANKKKFEADPSVDYHYRRYMNTTDEEAGEAVKAKPVWGTTDGSDADLEVAFDDKIDLSEYVQAHMLNNPHTAVDLTKYGMSLSYELVKNYKIGTNNTDQADFATLSGSVLTPKVFDDTEKYAAVGRTPVVRVLLKKGDAIVKVAYIKVKIVKEAVEDKTVEFTTDDFTFKCELDSDTVMTTVKQTNVQLYNACGMDRDEFHNTYTYFDAQNDVKGNVGTVTELKETTQGETTHLLRWTVDQDTLWKYAGNEVTHVVYYRPNESATTGVKITLKANIDDIAKSYNIATTQYIDQYWNTGKTLAQFNVNVPDMGSEDATKCLFNNDLNSPFVTDNGKIEINKNITGYNFFFDESMTKVTKVGDVAVKFTIEDGTTLKATVDGTTETVATIDNAGTEVPYNVVKLNKNSDIAKKLLNTGVFDVNYGVTGVVCNDNTKTVTVTFNGKSYFTARFVQPVKIAGKAADNFIDGVDFGKKGTFIALEDLIAPTDWRNYNFVDNTNYWKYYGPFTINADLNNAKSDLANMNGKVPATIELKQEAAGAKTDGDYSKTSAYGFITYKNNGTVVDAFNLTIPVVVEYGWGKITTEVTVPVAKTVNQAK
jgi:hypothetical protein